MKKITTVVLLSALTFIPTTASAQGTVVYKNQKAGQYCKKIDINKITVNANGKTLKCLVVGSKARWSA